MRPTLCTVLCLVGCSSPPGLGSDGGSDAVSDVGADANPQPSGDCRRSLALAGDSNPCRQLVYPDDTLYNSVTNPKGRVLDVTQFGANGSDDLDDTAAFIATYNHVMDALENDGWTGFTQNDNKASFIIYIPDGTYKISHSIIYSGATRYVPDANGQPIMTAEAVAQLRFVGQSREKTILQLTSGTFASSPGAVLAFGKQPFNNIPAENAVRNLTIEVKPNNALATGIYFGGANAADIENVAVISDDRHGAVGIDDSIGTVVGPRRNITVIGFDLGFRMQPYHFTHPVLEHVSLREQGVAGIELDDGTASIRMLESNNTVPAVRLMSSGAHAVMIESTLTGTTGAAVQITAGHFFGRDLTVTGYTCGIRHGGACAVAGSVDEFVSDPPIHNPARPGPTKSLRLPVEEPPLAVWDAGDANQWVAPAYTFADVGSDASAAIQTAMNSGKPVVYFPVHTYTLNSTVTIPCTVKHVEGMFTDFVGPADPKFRVAADCPAPILVEDASSEAGVFLAQASMRTVVLSEIATQAFVYTNQVTTGTPTLFGYMIGNLKIARPFSNVRAFLRMASGESPSGTYLVTGPTTQVWVLGFKTEKAQPSFTVQNGATLEVLGGILNQYSQLPVSSWSDPSAIALQVSGATTRVSFVACTNGPDATASGNGFRTLVQDTSVAPTASIAWDDPALPPRLPRGHQEVIPLYVSY